MLKMATMQPFLVGLAMSSLAASALAAASATAMAPKPSAAQAAVCQGIGAQGAHFDKCARHLALLDQADARSPAVDIARTAPATPPQAKPLDPKARADLLVERAEVLRLRGNVAKSFEAVGEAERLAPRDADPAASRALMLFNLGDESGGAAELARALKLEPGNGRTLYIAMRQARFTGDLQGCVRSGTQALRVSPGDGAILGMRARCLAELGRKAEAEADLRAFESAAPASAYAFDDAAMAYLATSRPREAVAAARRAIALSPAMEDAHFDLISALMAMGAHDDAIAAFQVFQSAKVDDSLGVGNNLAWELLLAGRYADALRISEAWLAANPQPTNQPHHIANPQGYSQVLDTAGHAYAALGRPDEAAAAFVRAADINPEGVLTTYQQRLRALGFIPQPGEAGLSAALRACAATGQNCKLYSDSPRSGPAASP